VTVGRPDTIKILAAGILGHVPARDGNFLLLRPYHGEHGPKVPVTRSTSVCSGCYENAMQLGAAAARRPRWAMTIPLPPWRQRITGC
jgi:hypothetical protein